MIDLYAVAAQAIQVGAQILGPLLMFAGGFVGALFAVLTLILFIVELFE